jgi:ribosomal protein S18 acetylase RimI-like enzyme
MIIREATRHDLKCVIDLSEQAHAEAPHYARSRFVREKIENLGELAIGEAPALVLLVAERAGEIVGYLFGTVAEHYFSDARYGASISLYVAPGSRGSSAAYRLLREFETACRSRGAEQIQLAASVEAFAPRALRLYAALGYTIVGTLIVKYLEQPCHK